MEAIAYKFDVTNIDPYVGGSAPLPGGWYAVAISEMKCKPNNDADSGHNLYVENTVAKGDLKGRKLFENLNLWHTKSSAAVEIANKQLSSIGHAVGVLSGEDLTMLANKIFLMEVELTAGTPDTINQNTGETIKGRGPQNRVIQRKRYTDDDYAALCTSVPVGQVAGAAASQPQQIVAAANTAPSFNPGAQAQSTPSAAASAPAMNGAPVAGAAATPGSAGSAVPPWQTAK